jgi:ribonuclease P protein subunit RPR2
LAKARVDILWEQAKKDATQGRPDLARERVLSARKIAQKTRTKLPGYINRRICRTCGSVLFASRVRVRNNRSRHIVVTCQNCGVTKRYYF